jgi:hypothetical protein
MIVTYNSLETPTVHLSQEARVLGVLKKQRDDGPLELVRLDDPPRPAVAVPADAVLELRARQDLVPARYKMPIRNSCVSVPRGSRFMEMA